MVSQSSHPLAQYENLLETELHCLHHDLLKIENDDFFVLSPKKKAFFQIAIPCNVRISTIKATKLIILTSTDGRSSNTPKLSNTL